jgi:hypothetical protein
MVWQSRANHSSPYQYAFARFYEMNEGTFPFLQDLREEMLGAVREIHIRAVDRSYVG